MADTKLSALSSATPASGDLVYIVDVSDTTDDAAGSSKKATVADFWALVAAANEATDTTCFPLFVTAATGDLGPKTNAALTFNSNTGAFAAGAITSVGMLIARQSGGVAGTDEIQLSHSGTAGLIACLDGNLTIDTPAATSVILTPGSQTYTFDMNGNCTGIGFLTINNIAKISATGSNTAAILQLGGSSGGFPNGNATISCQPKTPSQITSNQNNYAPGVSMFYRLSSDASRDITGLSVGQNDGYMCEIWNVGSNNLVLKHQDTNSTAANRLICTGAADITLAADEVALLRYDSTTSRWRVRKV